MYTNPDEGKDFSSSIPLIVAVVAVLLGLIGVFLGISARAAQKKTEEQSNVLIGKVDALTQEINTLKSTQGNEGVTQLRNEMAVRLQNINQALEGQRQSILQLDQKIMSGSRTTTPTRTGTGTAVTPPSGQTPTGGNATTATAATPGTATVHTIAKGETLSTLAKKYNVSLASILTANPGIEPNKLAIGQKVNIPAK